MGGQENAAHGERLQDPTKSFMPMDKNWDFFA